MIEASGAISVEIVPYELCIIAQWLSQHCLLTHHSRSLAAAEINDNVA